ncbi:MAG: polyphenol oxidase family protein [Actinomycetota bacterium]
MLAKRACRLYESITWQSSGPLLTAFQFWNPNVDGLITTQKGIALAVLVADCIPLLMWDANEPCIAAVHVGRKGLMSNIAAKVVNLMWQMGSRDIHAQLGPSICGNCYVVGEDVYREVTDIYPKASAQSEKFAFALDLPKALQVHLTGLGVQ